MKKILILVLIFLCSSQAFSQRRKTKYYGSVAFEFAFPDMNGPNQILHYFNDNTKNIIKKFKDFGVIYGPNLLFGMAFDFEKTKLLVEFGFAIKFSNTKTAKYIASDFTRQIIDVSIKNPTINIGGTWFYKFSKLFEAGIGATLNLGSINFNTRTYNAAVTQPNYINSSDFSFFSSVGGTPSINFNFNLSKKVMLSLNPGYYFMFASQNLNLLNNSINGSSNPQGNQSVKFSGPTMDVSLAFRIEN